jgi:hypothetical protein
VILPVGLARMKRIYPITILVVQLASLAQERRVPALTNLRWVKSRERTFDLDGLTAHAGTGCTPWPCLTSRLKGRLR